MVPVETPFPARRGHISLGTTTQSAGERYPTNRFSSLTGAIFPLRVILEIIRLFDDRLDIEDRGSVDCFDRADQQAIGIYF